MGRRGLRGGVAGCGLGFSYGVRSEGGLRQGGEEAGWRLRVM